MASIRFASSLCSDGRQYPNACTAAEGGGGREPASEAAMWGAEPKWGALKAGLELAALREEVAVV
jgi:hypothetical protein